jgi:hypothetical protein
LTLNQRVRVLNISGPMDAPICDGQEKLTNPHATNSGPTTKTQENG